MPRPKKTSNVQLVKNNKKEQPKKIVDEDEPLDDQITHGGDFEESNEETTEIEEEIESDTEDEANNEEDIEKNIEKEEDISEGKYDDEVENEDNLDDNGEIDNEDQESEKEDEEGDDAEYSEKEEKKEKEESDGEFDDDEMKCIYKYADREGSDEELEEQFDDDDKNYNGMIVPSDQRITKPYITKYELVRAMGDRITQLTSGGKPMIKNTDKLSPKEIAELELKHRVMPFYIERPLPNGKKERWHINEFQNLD